MPDDCLTKMTCHLVADFKVQVNVHFHLYHIMNCHVQFWWLPEIGVWGLTYYECQRDDGMHVWIMYIVNTCSLLIIFICVNVNVINICTKHNTETFINTCNQWWSCFLLLLWSERANVWSYLVSVNLSQISVNIFLNLLFQVMTSRLRLIGVWALCSRFYNAAQVLNSLPK